MDFVQNQYVQIVAVLAGLLSAPLLILQVIRELISVKRGDYHQKSEAHLKKIAEISINNDAYMSACVLILIVRILAIFFCVTFSILMVISALFLHMANLSSPLFDAASITLLLLSSIVLLGMLRSAKRFSERIRERVKAGSMRGRTWV